MTDFDKDEFWKALSRLYDSTVRMQASIELLTHDVEALTRNGERDSENIRALARIAEIHERRLTQIEGGETT
jgi:hypothetical protein